METRIYEIGYLVLPTVGEEGAVAQVDGIKSALTERGAEHISEQAPELIELAYDMTKVIDNKSLIFETAFFGWVKFALDPEKVAEMTALLDANDDILRYLFIKTVREDTMAKKPVVKKEVATPDSHKTMATTDEAAAEAPAEKVNETELESAIDELVEDTTTEAPAEEAAAPHAEVASDTEEKTEESSSEEAEA